MEFRCPASTVWSKTGICGVIEGNEELGVISFRSNTDGRLP